MRRGVFHVKQAASAILVNHPWRHMKKVRQREAMRQFSGILARSAM
jgi:hypothetical protein